MSKTITILLHNAYQSALSDHCSSPRCPKSLDKLIRVRDLQLRAAKHFGTQLLKGPRL